MPHGKQEQQYIYNNNNRNEVPLPKNPNRLLPQKKRLISLNQLNSFTYIFLLYFFISFVLLRNSADVPDEWWQSTEIAYQMTFPTAASSRCTNTNDDRHTDIHNNHNNNGEFINIAEREEELGCLARHQLVYGSPSWEWHSDHRIRSYTYPFMFYWIPFRLLRWVEESITNVSEDNDNNKGFMKERLDSLNDRENIQYSTIISRVIDLDMWWSLFYSVVANVVYMTYSIYVVINDYIPLCSDTSRAFTPFGLALYIIRHLYYVIPKVTAACIATLLHYKVCSLSFLLGIDWKRNNRNMLRSKAESHQYNVNNGGYNGNDMNVEKEYNKCGLSQYKGEGANVIKFTSCILSCMKNTSSRTHFGKSQYPFSDECVEFATKVSQATTFLLLTNFMFLYTSTRQLSNVPEALLLMCLWEEYALWQLEIQALSESLSLEQCRDEIESQTMDTVITDKLMSKVTRWSDTSAVFSRYTYMSFCKILFYGGVGCCLRITMAVPFIASWFLFIVSSSVIIFKITERQHVMKKKKDSDNGGKGCFSGNYKSESTEQGINTVGYLPLDVHEKYNKVAVHVGVLMLITALMGVVFLGSLLVIDTYFYNLYGTENTATKKDNIYFFLETLVSYFSRRKYMLVITPYNFLKFNFISNSSALFGVHSVHWYFTVALPACCGLHILIPIMFYADKKDDVNDNDYLGGKPNEKWNSEYATVRPVSNPMSKAEDPRKKKEESQSDIRCCLPLITMLLVTSMFTLLIFSSLGHKEMRFIFPVTTPPFLAICGVLVVHLDEKKRRKKKMKDNYIPSVHANAPAENAIRPKMTGFTPSSSLVLVGVLHILAIIVISLGFKGGPLRVVHYFRSSCEPYTHDGNLYNSNNNNGRRIEKDGETQQSILLGGDTFNTDLKTVCQRYHSSGKVKGNTYNVNNGMVMRRKRPFSLHVLAGCYTLPGQSFYHRVFDGSVRAVSCSNMDMVEEDMENMNSSSITTQFKSDDDQDGSFDSLGNKAIKDRRVIKRKRTYRAVTEHELFLKDPLTFVKYAYLGIAPIQSTVEEGIYSNIDDKEEIISSNIMTLPYRLQKWIKTFQSANDRLSDLPFSEEENSDTTNKYKDGIDGTHHDSSSDPTLLLGYKRFSYCRSRENVEVIHKHDNKEMKTNHHSEDRVYEKSTECTFSPQTRSINGILDATYYDYEKACDDNSYYNISCLSPKCAIGKKEPYPDFLVIFSSTASLLRKPFLTKLSYVKMTSFYHTFAVVDDGTDYTIDIWVRVPSACR